MFEIDPDSATECIWHRLPLLVGEYFAIITNYDTDIFEYDVLSLSNTSINNEVCIIHTGRLRKWSNSSAGFLSPQKPRLLSVRPAFQSRGWPMKTPHHFYIIPPEFLPLFRRLGNRSAPPASSVTNELPPQRPTLHTVLGYHL